MILTKDNLLRFVCDNKCVTTTQVAEKFETTTMIASAALSGLSKEKLVAITDLKLGSTPYYYDPKQPEGLVSIGDKHLKNHEREVFLKLKNQQIVNDGALPIAERLAAARISDFAKPLEVFHNDKSMKFWIWFLRDLDETRIQIVDALNGASKSEKKKNVVKSKVEKKVVEEKPKVEVIERKVVSKIEKKVENRKKEVEKDSPFAGVGDHEKYASPYEKFIDQYFKKNYLKIEGKKTADRFIKYNLSLKVVDIEILMDAVYFKKKPTDADILKFYTTGNKPKIVFIENAAKKFFKLAESLDNLEVVNI